MKHRKLEGSPRLPATAVYHKLLTGIEVIVQAEYWIDRWQIKLPIDGKWSLFLESTGFRTPKLRMDFTSVTAVEKKMKISNVVYSGHRILIYFSTCLTEHNTQAMKDHIV